jgi:diaminopimelate epimerase
MRFFNPNGNEADMCGNGARCVARLAHDLHITTATMKFETRAGIISAEVNDKSVKLQLPPATSYLKDQTLITKSGEEINYDFINTGVPHAVVQTKNLENYPVTKNGYAIIKHQDFAPNETNVNFAQTCSKNSINIRTFERGVEDETLACGTGITATAITMALRNLVQPPVSVTAASGDRLIVDFCIKNSTVSNITLTGSATHVFSGETELDATLNNENNHA